MKKKIIMMGVLALAFPLFAEETKEELKPAVEQPANEDPQKSKNERGEEFQARQLKLMEKALKEIGVTEEQKTRIFVLQEEHMVNMKTNWKRLNKTRKELSRLLDESAPMEEVDAAILEVADAQAEQLRIFAHNRREMEKILGKEKNDMFMENARVQFRRHGRRPGPDMPPRPGQDDSASPPPPPVESGKGAPPPP